MKMKMKRYVRKFQESSNIDSIIDLSLKTLSGKSPSIKLQDVLRDLSDDDFNSLVSQVIVKTKKLYPKNVVQNTLFSLRTKGGGPSSKMKGKKGTGWMKDF